MMFPLGCETLQCCCRSQTHNILSTPTPSDSDQEHNKKGPKNKEQDWLDPTCTTNKFDLISSLFVMTDWKNAPRAHHQSVQSIYPFLVRNNRVNLKQQTLIICTSQAQLHNLKTRKEPHHQHKSKDKTQKFSNQIPFLHD
ncbi:hypothetical protein ILYODFUR_000097 [Ilyodon furcidens]|uniref:Uncharacterized protein n=1 Tax=Ilyodon furcidens TaxID=33524 RepID=A0ABV0UZ41_9TELE